MLEKEVILLEDVHFYLSENLVKYQKLDVYLDYLCKSRVDVSAQEQTFQNAQQWSKYFLRQVFNAADQKLHSLSRCCSTRAELELQYFIR